MVVGCQGLYISTITSALKVSCDGMRARRANHLVVGPVTLNFNLNHSRQRNIEPSGTMNQASHPATDHQTLRALSINNRPPSVITSFSNVFPPLFFKQHPCRIESFAARIDARRHPLAGVAENSRRRSMGSDRSMKQSTISRPSLFLSCAFFSNKPPEPPAPQAVTSFGPVESSFVTRRVENRCWFYLQTLLISST